MQASSSPRFETGRAAARYVLAVLYALAGFLHIARPDWFLPIMPHWVPAPHMVILFTGMCEIAGAVALAGRRLRRAAAWGLAVYAVCVYPANIKHAIDSLSQPDAVLGWWYHGPRLALQPVLVWWALFAGGIVHWPFARR